MPLTSSATDVFGIGTLVLVILCCGAGTLCLVYVLFFHFKVGKERLLPLRDFDSPWVVRMVLIAFAVLWSLGELLRLPLLKRSGGLLHRLDFAIQANLCRFHVVSSIGVLEPGFLLTVLFLVQGSLHITSPVPRSLNGRVLTLMVIFCLPVFILQLLVVTSSSFQVHSAHNENKEGFGGSIPSYFTKSFEEVVLDDTNTHLALCTYPFFSTLLLGLFSFIFVVYFSCLGMRLLHHVINRKLQMRVYWLVLAVVVLLPLHVLFLGFSARIKPSETVHEVLMFLGFLTVLLCTTGGIGILVVLPVADALAVQSVSENRYQRWQSFSTSPVEPFGRSISAVVSDDEELHHHVAIQSLLGAVSSTGTDAGSSSREASLSFDTMPKDLTLGPGGWLADITGSLTSPSSPTLPGKPLAFFPDKCDV